MIYFIVTLHKSLDLSQQIRYNSKCSVYSTVNQYMRCTDEKADFCYHHAGDSFVMIFGVCVRRCRYGRIRRVSE